MASAGVSGGRLERCMLCLMHAGQMYAVSDACRTDEDVILFKFLVS